MGRNASIQMFLLTLTGCSWMLLFLSIALPDYHVFREYHATHVAAAAAHTPPPREADPCGLCWGVGKEEKEAGEEGSSLEDDAPTAVGQEEKKRKARDELSGTEAPELDDVGGVGAFYYYTLHTTFTALRVRLKKAEQVAGDVMGEEVASLGERVASLQRTLTTHFSPRTNPYLRLTRPQGRPRGGAAPRASYPTPPALGNLSRADGEDGGGKAQEDGSRGGDGDGRRDVRRTVSVVVAAADGRDGVDGLLSSLARAYPGITVHLAAASPPSPRLQRRGLRLVLHGAGANSTVGAVSAEVLNHVATPYVLVATGMAALTRLARLDRLVWAAEGLGVWAVGGGLEAPSGQWRAGCLTSTYAHYEATWSRGRLGAAGGGCSLCQALEGPFLALTSALRHLGWDGELPGRVSQLDLFLRAFHAHHMLAAACPTSLFRTDGAPAAPTRASLLGLARRHQLHSVTTAGGVRETFSCSDVGVGCGDAGLALPPCCRRELADLVRFAMATCEARGMLCELQEGTLLGAVKVGGVMPWERDADITFHTKNFTALEGMRGVFDQAGYSLRLTDNRWCCVDGQWAGGQGSLSSGQWRAELWSQHAMDSEDNILAGRPLTKIEFDGSWVAAPTSPGHYVRNRYGVEVYRHAQHWMDTGRSSGWEEYEAGKFLPCPRPAHHACLDQYVPDGNLKLYPLCLE